MFPRLLAMSSCRHVFPAIRAQAAERLRVAAKERQQSPEGFVKELQNAMCLGCRDLRMGSKLGTVVWFT
jgi:hypothetical protein